MDDTNLPGAAAGATMTAIDRIKADFFAGLGTVENLGHEIANRLMAEVGHNATQAIGHVLDMVSEHHGQLAAVLADINKATQDGLAALEAAIDEVIGAHRANQPAPTATDAVPPAA